MENIPREAAFQHSQYCPPAPRCVLIGPVIIPLLSDWSKATQRSCPSVHHCKISNVEEVRFLPWSGLNYSTVRPFTGRRSPALLDVLTCYIKQINNHEESYCSVRLLGEKKHHMDCTVKFSSDSMIFCLIQEGGIGQTEIQENKIKEKKESMNSNLGFWVKFGLGNHKNDWKIIFFWLHNTQSTIIFL